MTLPNTSLESVDLDDLERELRDFASSLLPKPSSPPKASDDPLAELVRIIDRDTHDRNQAALAASVQPGVGESSIGDLQSADHGQFDLGNSIKDTFGTNRADEESENEPQLAQGDEHQAPDPKE